LLNQKRATTYLYGVSQEIPEHIKQLLDVAITHPPTSQMILPGRSAIPKIISNTRSPTIQTQPCGVDLTLKRIKTWTSAGVVDFDNALRLNASTAEVPFFSSRRHELVQQLPAEFHRAIARNSIKLGRHGDGRQKAVMLKAGSYLVEFNETVDVPLDLMGQIFVRSSLFRSGALLSAGVVDSGYSGSVGAMLQVVNPHGLLLFKYSRLAQMVFHQMSEPVEGYNDVYQGSVEV
jgi:dUTP pyrophosphatase